MTIAVLPLANEGDTVEQPGAKMDGSLNPFLVQAGVPCMTD